MSSPKKGPEKGPNIYKNYLFRNDQIREMRTLRRQGAGLKELAAKYKCSMMTVSRICTGQAYPDAGGPITRHS
jgi:hypothetical protein